MLELYEQEGLSGLTADEAATALDMTVLSVRPEVCHLFKEGKLQKTGEKRLTASGLRANVWRIVGIG